MADKLTPMMGQYRRIRNDLPDDTILFFRLGDFYEMFFDDAKTASEILDIALTKRNKVPMCGIPFHAVDTYLAKILRAGCKVAICDQVEDPAEAKGIVKREVTRIITPGTITEENVLEAERNNFLAGLTRVNNRYGMAVLDISTGTFWLEEDEDPERLRDTLLKYRPSECIVPEERAEEKALREPLDGLSLIITPYDDWVFECDAAGDLLTRHFNVHSLTGFGCAGHAAGVGAAGAVLHYVSKQLKNNVDHIRKIRARNISEFMVLDEDTINNLELISARSAPGAPAHTLLNTLDATRTAMGGRLLRDWILRPLRGKQAIDERLESVNFFFNERVLLRQLREKLGSVKDLERLISRLSGGSGNARDVRALAVSLEQIPELIEQLSPAREGLLAFLQQQMNPLPDVCALIERGIVDEPPVPVKDGGIIREGYHEELDELRGAAAAGKQWLLKFQAGEQKRTGIKNLKVRHNKVFGYYIEVTKANLDSVPDDYVRKQTLVNAERFITPELKEYENKILGAQERSVQLEYELFMDIRKQIVEHTESVQQTAEAVACVDALAALAEHALHARYVKPEITERDTVHIVNGRHPVIEQIPGAEKFVPNDTLLDNGTNQLLIITGPNMAGKSTYIRQVALIVILAQIGSFVPAERAEIGVVDRVFTRVGASDDLSRGRSTFMVEMQEAANILNNATNRSLIVLDEIGRGTSTFDGISIAWAVAEYLHNTPEVRAKTLFATHYHELTDLARTMDGVQNYNVLVREKGEKIAFLRKIAKGAADKSYGIQVARLAGLPDPVIERAQEILGNLEDSELNEKGQPQLARRRSRKPADNADQLNLFGEE